jgi:hypothetical protein
MTFSASVNSARERSARSAMPSKALAGFRSSGFP